MDEQNTQANKPSNGRGRRKDAQDGDRQGFNVTVSCRDATHQEEVYERLNGMGYDCRR